MVSMPVFKDIATDFTISGEMPPQGEMPHFFFGLVAYGNPVELAAHFIDKCSEYRRCFEKKIRANFMGCFYYL